MNKPRDVSAAIRDHIVAAFFLLQTVVGLATSVLNTTITRARTHTHTRTHPEEGAIHI